MIAPTGGSRFVHPDGERAGARAAGRAGTIQWVTTFAAVPIEEVVRAASGPVFFQLYYPGSLEAAAPLIERVRAAGCAALALTGRLTRRAATRGSTERPDHAVPHRTRGAQADDRGSPTDPAVRLQARLDAGVPA